MFFQDEYTRLAGRNRGRRFAGLRYPRCARRINTLSQTRRGGGALLSLSHLNQHGHTVTATVALLTNEARFFATFSSSRTKPGKGGILKGAETRADKNV